MGNKFFVKRYKTAPINRIIDVLSSYGGIYKYNPIDATAEYFRIESDGMIRTYDNIDNKTFIKWIESGYELLVYSEQFDNFSLVTLFEVVREEDKKGKDKFEIWPAGYGHGKSDDDVLMCDNFNNCKKFVDILGSESGFDVAMEMVDKQAEHERFLHRLSKILAAENNSDNIYRLLRNIFVENFVNFVN